MNRFSGGPDPYNIKSTYIPLPLDLIARKLEQRQGQHDTYKAQLGAMENEVLGVKGMTADEESLKKIQQEYNERIGKQVEAVGGDYSQLGGIVDTVGRELKQDFTHGRFSAIAGNLQRYNKQLEQIDKMKAAGTYGERAEALFARDVANFKGTVNEDGTYNTFSPREAVKQVNIPKVADDYAGKLADQYGANGIKYIGDKGTDYVLRDLYNDSDVRNDAEEEIRYRFGDLTPKEKDDKVYTYLQGLAKNAVDKRKYTETLSPTEQKVFDDLGENPIVDPYSTTGGNPNKNPVQIFNDWTKSKQSSKWNPWGDSTFEEGFLTPEEVAEIDKQLAVQNTKDKNVSVHGLVSTATRKNLVLAKLGQKGINLDNLGESKEGKEAMRTFIKTKPILLDAIEAELAMQNMNSGEKDKKHKTTVDELTGDEIKQLLEKHESRTKTQNESAVTSQVTRITDKDGNVPTQFETAIYPGVLRSRTILDQNGNVLSTKDTEEFVNAVSTQQYAEKGGGVKSLYGGIVSGESTAQPHPRNSYVVDIKDSKGKITHYYVVPPEVNAEKFREDRAAYAFNSPQGYVYYHDGAQKVEIQRVVNKDPNTKDKFPFKVKMYLDGKEYVPETNK